METSVKGVLHKAGRPLQDAIVMVKGGSHEHHDMASVSNDAGEFYVSGITIPGKYVLQIQHGEGTITKEINVQSGDKVIEVDV